jgi:hypothetical protein
MKQQSTMIRKKELVRNEFLRTLMKLLGYTAVKLTDSLTSDKTMMTSPK